MLETLQVALAQTDRAGVITEREDSGSCARLIVNGVGDIWMQHVMLLLR
jgi:hypothetical protein